MKVPSLNVVIRHIASSAQVFVSGGKVSNCLIHPSVRQAVHENFAKEIKEKLQWCRDNQAEFQKSIQNLVYTK